MQICISILRLDGTTTRVSTQMSVAEQPDGSSNDAFWEARRRLAERVAQLRIDANLTQREAARQAGIDQATWSRLERMQHDPSLSQVLKVQRFFRLESIESFFGPSPSGQMLGVQKTEAGSP